MKRMLALVMALVVCLTAMSVLTACSGGDENDVGAEIRAYLVPELYDFDPAKAYTNDDAMKIMSLVYEPLFNLDENGTLQYGLAYSYRFYEFRGEFLCDIELRPTCWNDGDPVTADDVAYSWRRILDQNFACQAASLLYEIKNARAAKLGDVAVEDAGIEAQNLTLTLTFEEELNEAAQQNFLRNLTSVALSPVKDSVVNRNGRDDYWSKKVSYITTNGPFAIRQMDHEATDGALVKDGYEFRLERNNYYRRDKEANQSKTLYVSPAKFLSYWNQDLDDAFTDYIEGTIFYVGDIPLEQRATYLAQAKIVDMLSTYTYVLDNEADVFANAKVRRALSLCIDREALVAEAAMGLGCPATGFVSHGVYEGAEKGGFSDVTAAGAAALATGAKLDEALALLKSAMKDDGYNGGDKKITLLVRDNAEEKAIAKMVTDAWSDLFKKAGLAVTVRYEAKNRTAFNIKEDNEVITLYKDTVQEAYRCTDDASASNYNVLAIDYQMLSADAFSALASFSKELSGNGVKVGIGTVDVRTHVCGFDNADYNTLLDNAFAEKDLTARAAILHEAEAKLLEEMPVIPLIFNQSATLASSELARVYQNYYGYAVFTRTEMRNYRDHFFEKTEQ